jgi:tetratricopeptide (TPR) repeat protein
MKSFLLLIVCAFLFTSCASLQDKSSMIKEQEETILFTKAFSYFEVIEKTYVDWKFEQLDTTTTKGKIEYKLLADRKESLLELSLDTYEEFITAYPKSKLVPKALYNLAHINSLLGETEEEISYLQQLLAAKANDRDASGRNGLMENPYANYKHEASWRLTQIYIDKGDFEKALAYKKINDTYPLQHFCGNAFAAEEIFNAQAYGAIYHGMGKTKKALHYLLPHIFENGFADNKELVTQTIAILKEQNDIDTIKSSLKNAMSNISTKTELKNDYEWTNYYITFQDTEILVPSWGIFEEDENLIREKISERIQTSEFYKRLHE